LMGMKLAQVSLSYGVDDLDGTVIEEKIYHMAGAQTPQQMAREELVRAILEAGREPVQRDSLYKPVMSVERGASNDGKKVGTTVAVKVAPPSIHEPQVTGHEFAGASNEGGVA
jgi:aminodeoxyfutalosine synthase